MKRSRIGTLVASIALTLTTSAGTVRADEVTLMAVNALKEPLPESGVQVGELVARGEADLGFQQVSELIHVKGIDYLGPLPAEIQNITTYSAALAPGARSPEAAKALVKYLTAPDAAPVLRKAGLEPG